MDTLKNRIEAMNQLHESVNRLMPLIMDSVRDKPVKINADGRLAKKDKDRLQTIISNTEVAKGNLSVWISELGWGSPDIVFKTFYAQDECRGGGYIAAYIEKRFGLSHVQEYGFEALPLINIDIARHEVATLPELKEQLQSLKSRIYEVERVYIGR